jgi:hypothetical protein
VPTAAYLVRGQRCVLAVVALLGGQYALYSAWEVFVEPFALVRAAAWVAGVVPLTAGLSLVWRGNRLIARLVLLAHALIVLGVGALVYTLFLLPWPAGPAQRKAWFLAGLGALSALVCLLLSRPSARAFLAHQRAAARPPPGPSTGP